jgi:hypothetical protein
MIGATVLRALVLTAVFSAGLTPVTCLSQNSNPLPTKATKELPPELLSLLRQKKMPKLIACSPAALVLARWLGGSGQTGLRRAPLMPISIEAFVLGQS